MKPMLGFTLALLWLVCLALVVIGEAQALLLILATVALLVFSWGESSPPEDRTPWH